MSQEHISPFGMIRESVEIPLLRSVFVLRHKCAKRNNLTCPYVQEYSLPMRRKTTLSIEADLIDRMKMQGIRERRDVSTITEELYATYLEKAERSAMKPKTKQKT